MKRSQRMDDVSDLRTLDELDNEELAVRAQGGSLASFDLLVQISSTRHF